MEKEERFISLEQCDEILKTLEIRFEKNRIDHKGILWKEVKKKLVGNIEKLKILYMMEVTGGEPDVIYYNKNMDEYTFMDCSAESPSGRRSVCYDRKALEERKKNKPNNSAMDMACEIGVELLTERQYGELQKYGVFDQKSSSWVKTPDRIRELGGAIFCDCRYNRVFTYHNGAQSYYSARGFRGFVRV